jgi:outer membrane receptor protein involved in Fe transport
MSAYLQDAWSVGKGLTLRLGVRYDEVSFDDNEGQEVANLDKVQPRIGFAWDALGDATTVVRGYWGRFMHPSALTLPSFARTSIAPTEVYISCTRFFGSRAACLGALGTVIDDPLRKDPNGFGLLQVLATAPNGVDSDLTAMYADGWSIGVERQLGPKTSVELSYVKKDTKDIFEDTCDGNVPTPNAAASCDSYVMANLPGLRRNYEGIILRAESRAFDWLHLNGSYTYSKSQGNIGATQNAGTDFDFFPVHFDNRYGYLNDDRRHRVKLNGFVDLPMDFGFGFTGFWSSKFAYSALEDADPYGVHFAEPRGSRRASDAHQLDLELRKGFTFGNLRTQLVAVVYNALNHEGVTDVCDDFDSGCGENLEIPFGGATEFQQPRSYEAGIRLVF